MVNCQKTLNFQFPSFPPAAAAVSLLFYSEQKKIVWEALDLSQYFVLSRLEFLWSPLVKKNQGVPVVCLIGEFQTYCSGGSCRSRNRCETSPTVKHGLSSSWVKDDICAINIYCTKPVFKLPKIWSQLLVFRRKRHCLCWPFQKLRELRLNQLIFWKKQKHFLLNNLSWPN